MSNPRMPQHSHVTPAHTIIASVIITIKLFKHARFGARMIADKLEICESYGFIAQDENSCKTIIMLIVRENHRKKRLYSLCLW